MQTIICECGHELMAHELHQGDAENPSPCAGCAQQYGHGGCRAGGFQNSDTRHERLVDLFWAAELEMVEANHRTAGA